MEYVRSMMFTSLGSVPEDAYDPASLKKLEETAKLSSAAEHRRFLDLLLTARSRQSLGAFPQLPFELAIVEACIGSAPVVVSALPQSQPVQPKPAPQPPRAPEPARAPQTSAPREQFTPSSGDLPPSSIPTSAQKAATKALAAEAEKLPENTGGVLDIAELQEKWGRCCAYVAERNVALPLVLNAAKPLYIKDGKLTISFAYMFHANTMKDMKNQRLLVDAIQSVMMASPNEIECITEKGVSGEKDPVDTLVEAFGGQVL